jgi:hypothetical protein
VEKRRAITLALATAETLAALWAYVSQPDPHSRKPAVVPIQDGQTIDFSQGHPVVSDKAADKERMDAALKQIDESTRDVTFSAAPPAGGPTPTPTPAK